MKPLKIKGFSCHQKCSSHQNSYFYHQQRRTGEILLLIFCHFYKIYYNFNGSKNELSGEKEELLNIRKISMRAVNSAHNDGSIPSGQQRGRIQVDLLTSPLDVLPFLAHELLADGLWVSRLHTLLLEPRDDEVKIVLLDRTLSIGGHVAAAEAQIVKAPVVAHSVSLTRIKCADWVPFFEHLYSKIFIIWCANQEYKQLRAKFEPRQILSASRNTHLINVLESANQNGGFPIFFLSFLGFFNLVYCLLLLFKQIARK